MYDVLIIGSGIAGLVAGNLLAKAGKKVIIIERYRKVGGYLHSFDRFGCQFDTGAHYVGSLAPGQTFHTLLNYIDAYDSENFCALDARCFDEFRFPNFKVEWGTQESTIESFCSQFPEERSGIQKFFEQVHKVVRLIPTYEFKENLDANLAYPYLNLSLGDMVRQCTNNQQLMGALFAHCALHGVHPDDTPFAMHAAMLDSLMRGAHGFKHGGQAFAQTLRKAFEAKGGTILLRQGVTEIHAENQNISYLETNRGERLNAEWYISSVHPKHTFGMLKGANLKPMFRQRLELMKETCGLMGLYLGYKEEPELAIDRNYYMFDSNQLADFDMLREDLPWQPSKALYLSRNNRSRIPGTKGLHPLTIHLPVKWAWFKKWEGSVFADRPSDYHEFKEEIAEAALAQAQRYFPELKSTAAEMEISTPLSNIHYNGSYQGTAYGIYHSIEQTGPRALGPRTHLGNLLLTGQNTLFPGILSSALSGLRSAGHILGMRGMLRDLERMSDTQCSLTNYGESALEF